MPRLNGYERILVQQRDIMHGCIPTGIEWMMRYKGISVPDDFQEMYNLQRQGVFPNTFLTVSNAVSINFPNLNFQFTPNFSSGRVKFNQVENYIINQIPCLIPYKQTTGNWHIVPVVEIDNTCVIVLSLNGNSIGQQRNRFRRRALQSLFDNDKSGGQDLLALL